MSKTILDSIDYLAGIEVGSHLDRLRAERREARENAQKSYLALFEPDEHGDVTALERYAVAAFVSGLHRQAVVAQFYDEKLKSLAPPNLAKAIASEIDRGSVTGPYGRYPQGPLSREDVDGLSYQVLNDHKELLGARLAAALQHAHLLIFHPRDASHEDLQKLLDAGWSTTDIVTLSQVVSFLSFQIRVVAGLRALGEAARDKADQTNPIFTGALTAGAV